MAHVRFSTRLPHVCCSDLRTHITQRTRFARYYLVINTPIIKPLILWGEALDPCCAHVAMCGVRGLVWWSWVNDFGRTLHTYPQGSARLVCAARVHESPRWTWDVSACKIVGWNIYTHYYMYIMYYVSFAREFNILKFCVWDGFNQNKYS